MKYSNILNDVKEIVIMYLSPLLPVLIIFPIHTHTHPAEIEERRHIPSMYVLGTLVLGEIEVC